MSQAEVNRKRKVILDISEDENDRDLYAGDGEEMKHDSAINIPETKPKKYHDSSPNSKKQKTNRSNFEQIMGYSINQATAASSSAAAAASSSSSSSLPSIPVPPKSATMLLQSAHAAQRALRRHASTFTTMQELTNLDLTWRERAEWLAEVLEEDVQRCTIQASKSATSSSTATVTESPTSDNKVDMELSQLDPNQQDKNLDTLLHLVIELRYELERRDLLNSHMRECFDDNGDHLLRMFRTCDPRIRGRNGNTVLNHLAQRFSIAGEDSIGYRWLSALLENELIDLNSKDSDGNTALLEWSGDPSLSSGFILRILIEHGADWTIADNDGDNFLALLLQRRSWRPISDLVAAGCFPVEAMWQKNNAGEVPAEMLADTSPACRHLLRQLKRLWNEAYAPFYRQQLAESTHLIPDLVDMVVQYLDGSGKEWNSLKKQGAGASSSNPARAALNASSGARRKSDLGDLVRYPSESRSLETLRSSQVESDAELARRLALEEEEEGDEDFDPRDAADEDEEDEEGEDEDESDSEDSDESMSENRHSSASGSSESSDESLPDEDPAAHSRTENPEEEEHQLHSLEEDRAAPDGDELEED